jgi:hypothetical protein
LPEATNRRAVLSAVLAAGAAGAAAALPAAASAEQPLSAAGDQLALDLWKRRAELTAVAQPLSDQHTAATNQLPEWARSGDVYFRPDGTPAGLPAGAGWPLVDDLGLRPVDYRGLINARPGPHDLSREFSSAFTSCANNKAAEVTVLEEYGRAFTEFATRMRQKRAEEKRLGLSFPDSPDNSGRGPFPPFLYGPRPLFPFHV